MRVPRSEPRRKISSSFIHSCNGCLLSICYVLYISADVAGVMEGLSDRGGIAAESRVSPQAEGAASGKVLKGDHKRNGRCVWTRE